MIFYSLGFGDPMPISGVHGIGIGDLLDKVINAFPENADQEEDQSIKFSFIGRPKCWEIITGKRNAW